MSGTLDMLPACVEEELTIVAGASTTRAEVHSRSHCSQDDAEVLEGCLTGHVLGTSKCKEL